LNDGAVLADMIEWKRGLEEGKLFAAQTKNKKPSKQHFYIQAVRSISLF